MEQIGIFDAKTRFSEIVEQVQKTGHAVMITKRGQPVAEIVPTHEHGTTRMTRQEAFEKIALMREKIGPVTHDEIREMIEHGRR